jgi:hypothetical protein
VVSRLGSWLLIFSISLAFKSGAAGAHRRVSACSFPTSASISPGAFSTCFHPVPADDLVVREYSGVVFAFSVGCPSAEIFYRLLPRCSLLSSLMVKYCLVQYKLYRRDLGLIF